MPIAVPVHVGDHLLVGRLRPKRLRRQNGCRLVSRNRRRDHDDRDLGPPRHLANCAKEVPAIHHWHPQIEQNETGKLGLPLEPIKRVLAILRLMAGVALSTNELGNRLPRICVIVNYEYAAHGFGGPFASDENPVPRSPRARGRTRECTLGLCSGSTPFQVTAESWRRGKKSA